ncbi:hypothetical protein Patl1_11723 [Pistacia atlantica]|uniref:Uncharacterized protein n=1 Tax=Pistacia atlantica TaxID=434234 RepID=A0ACC1A8R2_9ROSI|nr:hypothetical protein Patl1_11723 [Pistacia atlantica]
MWILDLFLAWMKVLNSIFQQCDVQVNPRWWNISGEPCSGAAINAASLEDYNPAIKCNCSFENGSSCHITELTVFALDIKRVILEELVALQFLTNLEVGHNVLSRPLPKELGNLKNLTFL